MSWQQLLLSKCLTCTSNLSTSSLFCLIQCFPHSHTTDCYSKTRFTEKSDAHMDNKRPRSSSQNKFSGKSRTHIVILSGVESEAVPKPLDFVLQGITHCLGRKPFEKLHWCKQVLISLILKQLFCCYSSNIDLLRILLL